MVDRGEKHLHQSKKKGRPIVTKAGRIKKKYNIVQVHYSTVQNSTVQYSTVQNSTVQISTVQYSTV